jgi:hypothetical protein
LFGLGIQNSEVEGDYWFVNDYLISIYLRRNNTHDLHAQNNSEYYLIDIEIKFLNRSEYKLIAMNS